MYKIIGACMSYEVMCKIIARYFSKCCIFMTATEIFEYSKTGELALLYEWFALAILYFHLGFVTYTKVDGWPVRNIEIATPILEMNWE